MSNSTEPKKAPYTETKGLLRVEFTHDEQSPVMVYRSSNCSGNFFTVLETGTIEDFLTVDWECLVLSNKSMQWLESLEEAAEQWEKDIRWGGMEREDYEAIHGG